MASLTSTFHKMKDYLQLIVFFFSHPVNISLREHESTWHLRKDKLTFVFLIAPTNICWVLVNLGASLFFQRPINWKFASISSFCPDPVESWQIDLSKAELWSVNNDSVSFVNICDFWGPMLGVLQTLSSLVTIARLYSSMLCSLWAGTQNHAAFQRKSKTCSLPFRMLPAILHPLFY